MIASLEQRAVELAAQCLGLPPSAIAPDAPLASLGLDSLRALELAAALEDAAGMELFADGFPADASVSSLAAALRRAPARTASAPPAPWHADARLADALHVSPRRVRCALDLRRARAILLTGATGFLGGVLLRALLEQSDATLFCLVRSGARSARRRLNDVLRAQGVAGAASRVQLVEGDLQGPDLGLTEPQLAELARTLDAIVHAGARVNWVESYAALRAANVLATRELLRLAGRGRAIAFHFVSSLAVCCSTRAPRELDETYDALPDLDGLHLGYARSKAVAECLVRRAGARGLPFRIYRPSFIAGDSATGRFNPDDLLPALVAGCVRMGVAPDLDWRIDCVPVDAVAAAIVALSGRRGRVVHIAHHRPRHWRELALWLQLRGWALRLVPHAAWLEQLERETRPGARAGPAHPLRVLRSFFLARPEGPGSPTLPELHEEPRRPRVRSERSARALERSGVVFPALDTALLDREFDAFVAAGRLPDPGRSRPRSASRAKDPVTLARRLLPQGESRRTSFELLGSGSEHSILGELAAWRAERPAGLFFLRATAPGRPPFDAVLKLKARDRHALGVGEALADLAGARLGEAWKRCGERTGLLASHAREIAVYRQTDPRFIRHVPRVLGTRSDEASATWAVLLERVSDARLLDAADRAGAWRPRHIATAIRGLASLHAVWFGRAAELRAQPWLGHVRSTRDFLEMSDLWTALAEHAAPAFSAWAGAGLPALHESLIARAPHWRPALDVGPQTLIHGDFNPRNLCLRDSARRLCAYDWELATLGAPQRDLAELLCFCAPCGADRALVDALVERHRRGLERESGCALDPAQWREGFAAALAELLVDRLAFYALIQRVRPQPFLPRLLRTWLSLQRMFPVAGCA